MTITPDVREHLYGIQAGSYDGNDNWRPAQLVAFRIIKKTPRRIYYDANTGTERSPRIRYVSREAIESDGEVTRRNGQWWEPDVELYAKPPQTWPPQPDLDLAGLKAEMAAAHPDRGGSAAAFVAARAAYEKARENRR
ncbi:hypothetical protein [Streptomyces sp. CA-253872]|uniref:hypothetical protein n=1 Tax=Streptomyces sp. CA-253872 TaxID=3240067 RepID=UPI003D8AFCD2